MTGFSRWAPVAAWCALIFTLSSIPYLESGLEYDYPLRKVAHMTEYAILFALSRRAAAGARRATLRDSAAGFLFCLLYAAGDEYHQTFVAGRAGRWSDVAIDAAGAALALAWAARRPPRRKGPGIFGVCLLH